MVLEVTVALVAAGLLTETIVIIKAEMDDASNDHNGLLYEYLRL